MTEITTSNYYPFQLLLSNYYYKATQGALVGSGVGQLHGKHSVQDKMPLPSHPAG